jgi:hypothetical protein
MVGRTVSTDRFEDPPDTASEDDITDDMDNEEEDRGGKSLTSSLDISSHSSE